ncbi:MAG: hypothetical protein RI955_1448, partial [Bacteroidota bacterium]
MDYNKLLSRQIKKYLPEECLKNASFQHFIKAINDSYNSFERDKELANHAFSISEMEYIGVNSKLKSEVLQKEFSIKKLKEAINDIEGNEASFNENESLPEIINYLHHQIDKRKEAEKILQESELRMRHALETIGDNVWEYNKRTGEIFFSQCENLLLGYVSADYKTDTKLWWKCIYKEDRAKIKLRNELYRSGLAETHSLEYRLQHKDGTLKWVMDRGGIIEKGLDGKPLRIIGTLTDITHLKEIESELSSSANRLSYLISSLQEGILVSDANGKVLLSNIEFCKMFSIDASPEALIGYNCIKGAQQAKHLFADPEAFVNRMNELLEKKELCIGEELNLTDGKIFQRDFIPISINDTYNGHLWKYTDITERKNTENKIIRSEEKYRNIIANMNLGLIEVDLNENIQFANQSFCNLSGYDLHELIGANSENILATDSSSVLISKNELRREGKSDAYEMKLKTKNGDEKWCLVSGAPKYNDKGELIGSIGIHLDISEQKKMEIDLIDAREMAEHSAQAKEIFLANMSHEVRTPMNAILGMSKQLQKTSLTEKQSSLLNIIASAGENLLVVINDVLDLSKIEAGKLTIENIGFNLHEVVSRAMQVISHRAEEKGLKLVVDFDNRINKILIGDPYRTNQILLNLLSNAVKFTEKGFVKIECKLFANEKNNYQTIKLKVIDSGIGMDNEFQKHLFQKFVQEDKAIARKYGGTGLGMSICKQLIELMNGTILVSSRKDMGTTIELELSFETGSIVDLPTEISDVVNSEVLHAKNILLVEDNEMNRLVACEALSHYHVNITEAINGLEAIEILKRQSFDIILMDVQMPVMDGYEATDMIRKVLKINTPIIALTANAIKGESIKCIEAGMNDFISKPFEEDDLVNIMAIWISKKHITNTISNNAEIYISSDSKTIYNLQHLKKISRGNEEFILKMKKLFITQIPVSVNEIKNAFAVKNFEVVKTTAHKIKPIIENLGIEELISDIRDIEIMALEQNDNSELAILIEKAGFILSV